jgi:uncharacterized membrane protein YesL
MNKNTFYQFFNHDARIPDSRLPSNRFRAYFDIVKHRFGTLVLLSLLTSVFFLPYFSLDFIGQLYINVPPQTSGSPTELAFRYFALQSLLATINIPFLTLGFLGLGGLFYVIKKLAFQQPDINLYRDFFHGVKTNLKESLLAGVLFSIYLLIFISNLTFYPTINDFPLYLSIPFVIVLTGILLLVISFTLYLLSGASLYRFAWKKTMKNNGLLAFILLPQNIGILLISVGLISLYYVIPYLLFQVGIIVVTLLYGFSHMALSYSLYAFKMFDRYINQSYEPDLVNQGLERKEE